MVVVVRQRSIDLGEAEAHLRISPEDLLGTEAVREVIQDDLLHRHPRAREDRHAGFAQFDVGIGDSGHDGSPRSAR